KFLDYSFFRDRVFVLAMKSSQSLVLSSSERSSPSRVCYTGPFWSRPLTTVGRSEKPSQPQGNGRTMNETELDTRHSTPQPGPTNGPALQPINVEALHQSV